MTGTKINIIDLSQIQEVSTVVVEEAYAPLSLSCGPTQKGPEGLRVVAGSVFNKLYGDPSFKKYGQVSIQNQRIIDAGGKILFSRLVADDATLANASVIAKAYQTSAQKKNAAGALLFYDGDMNETTVTTDPETSEAYSPVTIYTCHIFYKIVTVSGMKTIEAIQAKVAEELDDVGTLETVYTDASGVDVKEKVYTYPLYTITDNGRGFSTKSFNFEAEPNLSKNLGFMFYGINVIEGGNETDGARFSAIPNNIYNKECIDIDSAAETYLTQVQVQSNPTSIETFIARIADLSDIDEDLIKAEDFLFGTTRKGGKLAGIEFDTLISTDLTAPAGIPLVAGVDGTFTDSPATVTAAKAIIDTKTADFFSGKTYDDVFNLDVFQLDLVFDANFSEKVKKAIIGLLDYRKDAMFIADLGLNITNIDAAKAEAAKLPASTWVELFCQSYDVTDPYSLKREKVTILYDLAPMYIKHLYSGRNKPLAGQRNNAVITSIVDRTVLNYAPKVLPTINEKDELENLRINFASFYQNDFIVETLFTLQEDYSQLSFANNVMAVQQVIKALRVKFPAIRYQYITNESDITAYQTSVNEFLAAFSSNFAELRCEYIVDKKYLANKIYRAALYFRFGEFLQGELIDAYMLPSNI